MYLNPIQSKLYFSTYTNLDWIPVLENDKHKQIVLDSLRFLVKDGRIILYAFVIMPNHIHLIWRMTDKWELKEVQRDFLKFTAQKIRFNLIDTNDPLLDNLLVYSKDRTTQIWERNGLSFMLNDSHTIWQKMNYIHQNPIREKWKLADVPENYYYSSAQFYATEKDPYQMLTPINEILQ